jgi:hypothetical protein
MTKAETGGPAGGGSAEAFSERAYDSVYVY